MSPQPRMTEAGLRPLPMAELHGFPGLNARAHGGLGLGIGPANQHAAVLWELGPGTQLHGVSSRLQTPSRGPVR